MLAVTAPCIYGYQGDEAYHGWIRLSNQMNCCFWASGFPMNVGQRRMGENVTSFRNRLVCACPCGRVPLSMRFLLCVCFPLMHKHTCLLVCVVWW